MYFIICVFGFYSAILAANSDYRLISETVDITPQEAVRQIGEQLIVLCKLPYPIDSCMMTVGGIPYRLIPDNLQGDIVYAGQGLKFGECGALIKNIKVEWNGDISCILPPAIGNIEVVGTMRLQVARPTRKNKNLPTKALPGLENNNTSSVSNVSSSPHGNIKTSTNSSANNTGEQPTNNTFIILGSLTGITLTLIAIIAIWKRCWIKRSPQGTPKLPTNHHSEPFYLNMLFRRECAQEIEEIDQHQYEEITPHATEGG